MRIGFGYDVHRLVPDRRLVLCGVEIPSEKGLLGHSDADVAVHALCDAILGALALGDIGTHFPDNDKKYSGIDSTVLLSQVAGMMKNAGYTVGNTDITIAAERPRLSPFVSDMRQRLAAVLGCDMSCVSVKATTEEGLGVSGAEKGIAAYAVCLLEEK